MTRAARVLSSVACALLSHACQREAPPPYVVPPVSTVDMPSPPDPPACPVKVAGTDVSLVSVDGGSALVFTSGTARPMAVRRAAWELAARYQTVPYGRPGPPSGPEVEWPAGVPTRAKYADVVSGARIEIAAITPSDIPAVRKHVRKLLNNMLRHSSCRVASASREPSPD